MGKKLKYLKILPVFNDSQLFIGFNIIYIYIYRPNLFPRLYCRKAATNKPIKVTGISPNTIPNKSGSIIIIYYKEIIIKIIRVLNVTI